MWKFLEPVLDSPWTVWATCVMIYALNYVLVCMRPEMAMDFGSTKWSRCLVSGAHGQPTAHLGTVKNNPGLVCWIEIGPCVFQEKYCLNWMA